MFYIHNVPGRLRLRSEILKGNHFAADAVRIALSTIPGIGIVEINPVTGSILVHFNHQAVNPEDIISLLERKGYFDRTKANNADKIIYRGTNTLIKSIVGILIGNALSDTPFSFLGLFL
ncbi:MAG: HMA2 domain-containing protein [Dissulfurispiraceae bacterium]